MNGGLLEALNELIQPSHEWHAQTINGGEYRTKITQPSLIIRLEDAIRGGVGIGGSASLANERNMIDGDALALLVDIGTTSRVWARSAGLDTRPTDRPDHTLRRWYVAFDRYHTSDEVKREHLKIIGGWSKRIRATLDRPEHGDLPAACPDLACRAVTWWHAGQEYTRPLVYIKGPEGSVIEDGRAVCRACGATWNIRELANEIEQREVDDDEPEPATLTETEK